MTDDPMLVKARGYASHGGPTGPVIRHVLAKLDGARRHLAAALAEVERLRCNVNVRFAEGLRAELAATRAEVERLIAHAAEADRRRSLGGVGPGYTVPSAAVQTPGRVS